MRLATAPTRLQLARVVGSTSTSMGQGTCTAAALLFFFEWTRCGTAGSGLERVAGSTGMLRSDCSYSCVTHLNTFSASESVGLIVNGCRICPNRFAFLKFGSNRSASANIRTLARCSRNCAAIERCVGVPVTSCIVFERFGCGWRFAIAFGADTLKSSEPKMAKTRITVGSYGGTRCFSKLWE